MLRPILLHIDLVHLKTTIKKFLGNSFKVKTMRYSTENKKCETALGRKGKSNDRKDEDSPISN
jgi:hypothetical protein